MTLIDETIGAPLAPEPPPARTLRRVIAAASIAVVLGAVWASVAVTTVGQVSVVYDADPVRCEGSEVGPFTASLDDEFVYTAVAQTPGMQCELRMHVINDGWREVRITSVGLPQFGDDNPLKLTARSVTPNGQERIAGDAELNEARFSLDGFTVAAGSTELVTALFTYSGGTNLSECSAMLVPSAWAKFSALGMSRTDAPPVHSSIWFVAGPLAGCELG